MLYSEFWAINEKDRFTVKYNCVIRDIVKSDFSTYRVECHVIENGTSKEKLTSLKLSTLISYVSSKQMYVINPEILTTVMQENVSFENLMEVNKTVSALTVPSYTIIGYDTNSVDCVKVQPNNFKISNKPISMYIGFIVNEIYKYNLYITNLEVLQKCKIFGTAAKEKGKGVPTRDVTVDFVSDRDYTDTYILNVSQSMSDKEVQEVLLEAGDVWLIAHNSEYKGKKLSQKKVAAAKKAIDTLGYGPYAFVDYIHSCYGWSYRKNDESDFRMYYTTREVE